MEHLIPREWFIGLPQWALLLLSAVAIAVLIKGADWLVDGASRLAYRFGISKIIVGATVVSLGTTSPECAVSVMAAWTGEPGLALGNAVGSIIADTGLIFGLGCLLAPLPADRFVLTRQGWVQFGAGAALAALCYGLFALNGDGAAIGRWPGLLLLGFLAIYLRVSIGWSRQHPQGEPFQMAEEGEVERASTGSPARLAGLCVAGLALVVFASHILILSVTELAEAHWHVPKVVIASTLVAFGTSLPELVIGMTSIARGHHEILVGNVIGADILNVLFVVGAAATAAPLALIDTASSVPRILLYLHLPTMLAVLVLFRLFIHAANRTGRFRRWQGIPLMLIYVLYVVLQYAVT